MSKVAGLDRLRARLAKLPNQLKVPIKAAVHKSADVVSDEIRRIAPQGKTGKLKQSVRTVDGKHELAVLVQAGGPLTTVELRKGSGETWDYAIGVEYGTQAHIQEGFLTPDRDKYTLTRRRELKAAIAAGDISHHPGTPATHFFYGTWQIEKKRAKARVSRAIRKAVLDIIQKDKAA